MEPGLDDLFQMETGKMRHILLVPVVAAIALSACAPATPTVDAAQIQASAMAAASTMIALTVAAVPTSTPIPPTPLPSPTPLPLPTLPLPSTLAAASPTTASASNCSGAMDVAAAGPKAPVVIKNEAKAPITFIMGFSTKNTFGQCGSISWSIGRGQSISVQVPQVRTNLGDSCYWTYIYVNDPKKPNVIDNGQSYCIDNDQKWTFDVSPTSVKLTPP